MSSPCLVGVEINRSVVHTGEDDTLAFKYMYHLPDGCHTERSKSTWLVRSSALLVLPKDVRRVLLANRFGTPYPSPRGNLQAVEIAAHVVEEMSKQNMDVV